MDLIKFLTENINVNADLGLIELMVYAFTKQLVSKIKYIITINVSAKLVTLKYTKENVLKNAANINTGIIFNVYVNLDASENQESVSPIAQRIRYGLLKAVPAKFHKLLKLVINASYAR